MGPNALSGVEAPRPVQIFTTPEAIKQYAQQLQPRKLWYRIDPRTSRRLQYWDALTTLALLFTALVTPYEISLLEAKLDVLFYVNRVVDMIFSIDVFVNFVTMKQRSSGTRRLSSMQWEDNPLVNARIYLTSWFLLDVLSVAVSALDILAVSPDEGAVKRVVANLVGLKMLRVLRLLKLARLLRSSRIVMRWATRVSIAYSTLSIITCVGMVCIFLHWMACVWVLQADLVNETPLGSPTSETPVPSWLGASGYCVYVDDANATLGYTCEPPVNIYMAAFYWSTMTMATIGYGDIAATFNNPVEMGIASFLMLASAFYWASVIGTFCGVVSSFNPEENAFHALMDELNRFMSRESVPLPLRLRLREYFRESKHIRFSETKRALMLRMAPSLKGEIAFETSKHWIGRVSFLKGASRPFVMELCLQMLPVVYAPGDVPKIGFLYVVYRGIALYRVKLLTTGKVWGEDMILSSPKLRSTAQARAMNYLEVYYIGRHELLTIAAGFHTTARRIRRVAVLLALRRHLIQEARLKLRVPSGQNLSDCARLTSVFLDEGTLQRHAKVASFDNAFKAATMIEGDEEKDFATDNLIGDYVSGGAGGGAGAGASATLFEESRREMSELREVVTCYARTTDAMLNTLALSVHQVAARLEKLMLDQQVIHLKKNRLHQHRSRRLSSHSGVEPPGSYQGATEDGTGELPGSAAPGSPSQGTPAIVVLAPITDPLAQERGRHSCTQEDRDQDGEYAPMRRERPPGQPTRAGSTHKARRPSYEA